MTRWSEAAAQVQRGIPLHVVADTPGGRVPLDDEALTAVVHASRELLANVVRHAGVEEARWTVRVEDRRVSVAVVDHGRGYAPDSTPGIGLSHSVTERMTTIGGSVSIDSRPGSTTVELSVPVRSARRHLTLAESFDRTLHIPGAGRASDLARWVALPLAAGNTALGLRYGLVGDHAAIQITTWVVVLVSTWLLVRQLDHGPPTPATCVGLVAVVSAALAVSLTSAGPGAVRTFDSWMIGAFSIPLVLLAYVVPLRWAVVCVLPNLVIVLVVIGQDDGVTLAQCLGALSSPFTPLMAGILGVQQRRSAVAIDRERRRLVDAEVAARATRRRRDIEHVYLASTLDLVVPYLEDLASGRARASDADDRVIELAGMVRDDLYAPGLMNPELREAARDLRRAGGVLQLRSGLAPSIHQALAGPLAEAMSTSPSRAAITVSPRSAGARIVIADAEGRARTIDVEPDPGERPPTITSPRP